MTRASHQRFHRRRYAERPQGGGIPLRYKKPLVCNEIPTVCARSREKHGRGSRAARHDATASA